MRKKKRNKLWSLARISDARFPGLIMRITELTPGKKLYAVHQVNGKQRMRCLQCTRASLGSTAKEQDRKARAIALDIIAALANGTEEKHSQPVNAFTANAGSTVTFGALAVEFQERGFFGKTERYRQGYSRRVHHVTQCIGAQRAVASLLPSDVERYMAARMKSVRQSTARGDIVALKSAVKWAVGEKLLNKHDNPFDDEIKLPKLWEKPRRPLADRERYLALKAVAPKLLPAFETLLDLAASTGRRIGAILGLKWRDIDFEKSTIRWYAGATGDNKKQDQTIHMPQAAREALVRWRKQCPGVGGGWTFPSPKDPKQHLGRYEVTRSLRRAEKLAHLPHEAGGGWHAFRRAWATERKHFPLVDVAAAGGWGDTSTLLKCYVAPDAATTLRVLEHTA